MIAQGKLVTSMTVTSVVINSRTDVVNRYVTLKDFLDKFRKLLTDHQVFAGPDRCHGDKTTILGSVTIASQQLRKLLAVDASGILHFSNSLQMFAESSRQMASRRCLTVFSNRLVVSLANRRGCGSNPRK